MNKIILVLLFFAGLELKAKEKYNVIVYGATPAGVITAINLAQKDYNVLIIEPTNYVGGMYAGGLTTSEIMHMIKGCISGMAQEYYIRLGHNTSEGYYRHFTPGMPAYFFECKNAEKTYLEWLEAYKSKIDLVYGQRVTGVKKNKAVIESVTIENKNKYAAKYFVDCSYEGDLMKYAGVSYASGRESKNEYNETFAGVRFQPDTIFATTVDKSGKRLPYFKEIKDFREGEANECVAAYNYRCIVTQVKENQVPFTKPTDYSPENFDHVADFLKRHPNSTLKDFVAIIKRGNGKTEFNTKQIGSNTISIELAGINCAYPLAGYATRDQIRSHYKSYTKGLYYFLTHDERVPNAIRDTMKTYGYAKDEFVKNENFPYYFYIREALRLKGEYILTERDLFENRTKEDAVLLGSHYVDCHSNQKIALSDTSYIKEGYLWVEMKQPYEIPYRAILPKRLECENLLVPVCVSASHVAFCSVRLESTWMQLGHAAALAIDIASKAKCGLHEVDVKQLQSKLREEKMVVKIEELKQ
jgi:hypothetical protein